MASRNNTAVWYEKRGCWRIVVCKDGEKKSFWSYKPGRTGQKECNAKADAWLDDGLDAVSCTRVEQLYDAFLEQKKDTTSRSNYEPMLSRYNNWIKPIIGRRKISALTEMDCQRCIDKAFSAKGLSKKSLMLIRADLSSFLKYCRRLHLTEETAEFLTIPTAAKKPNKAILQPNEILVLFNKETTLTRNKEASDPYINAYRFQVLTGLRPGEVIGLEWSDVKKNRVEVRRSVNKYGDETTGKNDNAQRTVALSQQARDVLDAQRAITGNQRAVFGILSLKSYREMFQRYCAQNGLQKHTVYELRHTFVSMAASLPEGMVKELVGHSQSMDTFGVYGHEYDGKIADQSEELTRLFADIV